MSRGCGNCWNVHWCNWGFERRRRAVAEEVLLRLVESDPADIAVLSISISPAWTVWSFSTAWCAGSQSKIQAIVAPPASPAWKRLSKRSIWTSWNF